RGAGDCGETGTGRDGEPRGIGEGGCSATGVGRDGEPRGIGDGGCSAAGVGREGDPRAGVGVAGGRICVPPDRICVAVFPGDFDGVLARAWVGAEMVRRKSSRDTWSGMEPDSVWQAVPQSGASRATRSTITRAIGPRCGTSAASSTARCSAVRPAPPPRAIIREGACCCGRGVTGAPGPWGSPGVYGAPGV